MIRTAGAALLGLGWLAITLLTVLNRSGAGQNLPALGLAALGFVSGSAGAAALVVGRGLLERIETSARWQSRTAEIERRSDDEASPAFGTSALPAMAPETTTHRLQRPGAFFSDDPSDEKWRGGSASAI